MTELYKYEAVLRDLYCNQNLSLREIGKKLGCSYKCVQRYMQNFGIERRNAIEAKNLKGEPINHYYHNGYEKVRGDSKEVRIHRLIMVSEHGVEAVEGMEVHHKNEVRWDNRPENLELMTTSEHISHHNSKN